MLFQPILAAAAGNGGEGGHGPQVIFDFFGIKWLEVTSEITTMWGVMIFLIIVSVLATRDLKRIPSGIQNVVEGLLEAIIGFLSGIMGKEKARKYFPLLGSFFILILVSNYSGLLPGAGMVKGFKPPTSTLSVTAGLAIVVFFATHYLGVKERGLAYFKHFIEPMPFMLPLNIIEEFVKPLSLALRLYGNVFGEEMVVASLFVLVPFFVPVPMMVLGVLFGLIQAFVFTLLAAVYLGNATAHHH